MEENPHKKPPKKPLLNTNQGDVLSKYSILGMSFIWLASPTVIDPDDYRLCEWLFPWFCGFVQLEQWPHCNPWLFTFQQISSYWNHGEVRAGVKEDSHRKYLYKPNTCLSKNSLIKSIHNDTNQKADESSTQYVIKIPMFHLLILGSLT